jgi:Fe-S oxidoreductase
LRSSAKRRVAPAIRRAAWERNSCFQAQAQANIETMHQYRFKKIVTTCAHCFNTIKNEYPQFGGRAGIDYQVIHHTDLLAQLVRDGKLTPKRPINQKVVYHDPCYIGRYNDIYDSPRAVLQAIPGVQLVEAPDWNRERAMCCGGGGGNVWMEGWGKRGVNAIRLEQLMQEKTTDAGARMSVLHGHVRGRSKECRCR